MNYLFKSNRLGFRNWNTSDIDEMAALNSDEKVMEFFPSTQDRAKTRGFIERMQALYERVGFCYFAVDILEGNEFIGFIGICEQNYEAEFTPCVDIGWRLKRGAWGKGYATEGAKRCLDYAFTTLNMDKIYSIASVINTPSINVMKKAGMTKVNTFNHPVLLNDERLKECVLYLKHNAKN